MLSEVAYYSDAVLMVGVKDNQRHVSKLNAATGTELWGAPFPSESRASAFELPLPPQSTSVWRH